MENVVLPCGSVAWTTSFLQAMDVVMPVISALASAGRSRVLPAPRPYSRQHSDGKQDRFQEALG